MDLSEEKYYLEKVEIPIYEDSEFDYKSVKVDELLVLDDNSEETLEKTSKMLEEINDDATATNDVLFSHRPKLTIVPPSIDDFVRSFLLKLGFTKTLDRFQLEWYERKHKGLLNEEDIREVPDIYVRNQQLDNDLKMMRVERDKYKEAALAAKEVHVKLRSERDYHKLQHRRVLQEKNRLIEEIKRIREHYASYEPAIEELQKKYQVAMKEKMLSKLERDRVCGQMQGLQMTLQSLEMVKGDENSFVRSAGGTRRIHGCQKGGVLTVDERNFGPSQRKLMEARQFAHNDENKMDTMKDSASAFPTDIGVNEDLQKVRPPPGHLTRVGGFRLTSTVKAHDGPVTCVRLSRNKKYLATSSDDNTWKLWSAGNLELVMTGRGHSQWVSSVAFDESTEKLATSSGDKSLKIWDINEAVCLSTLTGAHSLPIWCVDWHRNGPFLASCGMDKLVKVWDIGCGQYKCRSILRGHSDSVNCVQFVVNSNILLSASADKTLGLWDGRSGINGQMIVGHQHSINSANINQRGTSIVSCDSFGFVNFWDCRNLAAPIKSLDLGFHPANDVRFDSSGACVAISSNDGIIRMIEATNYNVTTLVGHEDAVQTCIFDIDGDILVSGSTDCTVKVWS